MASSSPLIDELPRGTDCLGLCRQLFEALDREGIRHCHFKSNLRLDRGLAGETDLDLLVAPADRARFTSLVRTLGFRGLRNPPGKRVPGLEDYLGLDAESGGLSHLHVHYRLVVGPQHAKSYALPMEELILANLIRRLGVPVPCPEIELLVLILRAILKLDPRALRRRGSGVDELFPSDILEEFDELCATSNETRFTNLLSRAALPLGARDLLDFAHGVCRREVDVDRLRGLRERVLRALRPHRWSSPARDLAQRLARARGALGGKKSLARQGASFALVGPDGSGKSTLVRALHRWLAWKLAARSVYLGLPKQSRTYRVLRRAEKVLQRLEKGRKGRLLGGLWARGGEYARCGRWLHSARCRRRRHRQIRRLVRRGVIVIADRYPLAELRRDDFSVDGPRIRAEFGDRHRLLAALEERCYEAIGRPSCVFVLRASSAELERRKPDLPPEVATRKVPLFASIAPAPGLSIVDADRPYEKVLLEIKREIWSRLESSG